MLQIPHNIRLIRDVAGLTQAKFGEMFGASVPMIKSYESGKAKPDNLFMTRVAKFAGVTVDDLTIERLSEGRLKIGRVEKAEKAPQEESTTLGVIKDLAESNKIIAESNRTLARSHEELVLLLKANSGNQDSEENQLIILAYQKVMFRYMARFGATAEGREPGVVLNEMGKTLAESLKVGVKGGKVGSSSDKA